VILVKFASCMKKVSVCWPSQKSTVD